uniref:Protein-glutamine gamma-glutamyltransferase K n=1 Tax=Scophthalmus maximus TaxID=52904 RepID=A0A8D3DJV0_SCOMX
MCPCCCKRQNTSTSYDITDKVEVTKPPAPEPAKPTPENGEAKEMEGNATDYIGKLCCGVNTFRRLKFDVERLLSEMKLSVRSVDLLSSKTGRNRQEHHTDVYHGDELIIRRGQTFQIELELNRPFNAVTDKLHLDLKTGPLPMVSKGTHVIIPLVDHLEDERWEAKIVLDNGNRVKLSVNSPANAVIGLYGLSVTTCTLRGEAATTHNSSKNIIMLFNPWCEEDTVFLDDEEERKEYVLNDTGRIYYGTEKQIGARTWNFGQFHERILDACLFILEKSDMPPSGRRDPVNVVRVVSALINAQDDFGVLVGNWSGNYSDGVSPAAWSSSVEILRKYHSSDGTPVSYGQCWVFSGVTTTVLRCLGIPARSVTNFQSAHDTDVSLTTDVYFNEDMEPIDYLNSDSVWNFHVWNDCWMARPDLPPGNGGWQAVDSTPQETSQGTFRCGPASVNAIRSGQVYLKHDTPFVFAEVNSDKIYWQRSLDGTFSQIHSEKKAVGHCISTKAVGSEERADITHLYKHQEGSEEERIAVETASRFGSKPEVYSAPMAEDVGVEVKMEGEGPRMGTDAKLSILVKNLSSQPRRATLHSQAAVMYYTGVLKGTIKKDQIPWKAWAYKRATKWLWGKNTSRLPLLPPTCSPPLSLPRLIFLSYLSPPSDVGGHSTVTLTEHFIPTQPGPRKLVASLDCKQLSQVHGVADIVVVEK